jgi:hypothetical protein
MTDFTMDNNIDFESDSGIAVGTEDNTNAGPSTSEISTPGPGEQGRGRGGHSQRANQQWQRGNVAHQHKTNLEVQEVGTEVA